MLNCDEAINRLRERFAMLSDKQHSWIAQEARRCRQRNLNRATLLVACALAAAIVVTMQVIIKYIVG